MRCEKIPLNSLHSELNFKIKHLIHISSHVKYPMTKHPEAVHVTWTIYIWNVVFKSVKLTLEVHVGTRFSQNYMVMKQQKYDARWVMNSEFEIMVHVQNKHHSHIESIIYVRGRTQSQWFLMKQLHEQILTWLISWFSTPPVECITFQTNYIYTVNIMWSKIHFYYQPLTLPHCNSCRMPTKANSFQCAYVN